MPDWSPFEVEALVSDYVAMLTAELLGQPYNKTEHRRALAPLLQGRSDGSIERKHQNVSAILIELGFPYIFGYKPLGNYQALLFDVVSERAPQDQALNAAILSIVDAPAVVPDVSDWLRRWEEPPQPTEPVVYGSTGERPPRRSSGVNYLAREAANHRLGRAGEEFVVQFERARLREAGRDSLADMVEHVAVTEGDGLGFDVRSYELNGKDRLIEVKTTRFGKQTPFFATRNEVSVSSRVSDSYHLFRLYRFRDDPRLYGLRGALADSCRLSPVQFEARVK